MNHAHYRSRGIAFTLAASICISMFTSCATRESRSTLGKKWPGSEPEVDLTRYEDIQKRPGQRSDVAVAVAISGGGMRAANFAAGVLKALEGVKVRGANGTESNLLREVDYFSTVSGGGLAAGSYISLLNSYQLRNPGDPAAKGFSFGDLEKGNGRGWRSALSRDYQASLVRALLNPLMAGPLDRGDILEERLDDNILGRANGRSLRLSDVFVPKGTIPKMPYWITNGTVFENGAIFPFTPDVIEKYGVNGYNHRLTTRRLTRPEDLPLSVGLKTSASFPVAIPPTTLQSGLDPAHPVIHLMDGGVADNLGVVTALRLLRKDKARKKVLIVIDAYNGVTEPFSKRGIRPGPVGAALRSTSISLDSAHQRIHGFLDVAGKSGSVRHAVIDFTSATSAEPDEAGLGSYMTDQLLATLGMDSMRQEDTSPQSLQAVFTQALGVGTWFRIDGKSQEVLLTAGQNAIFEVNGTPGTPRKLLKPIREVIADF